MGRAQLVALVVLVVLAPPVTLGGAQVLLELAGWMLGLGALLAVLVIGAVRTRPVPMTAGQWSQRKRAAHGAGGKWTPTPQRIPDSWKTGHRHHLANHEAGHAAVGMAEGMAVRLAVVYDGNEGGFCSLAHWARDPVANVAFLLGGQRAVNSQRGCSFDNALIEDFLGRYPADRRDDALAEATRMCDRDLGSSHIRRAGIAHELFETGVWRP